MATQAEHSWVPFFGSATMELCSKCGLVKPRDGDVPKCETPEERQARKERK